MKAKSYAKRQTIICRRRSCISPPHENHSIHHSQSQKVQTRKTYHIDLYNSSPIIQINCSIPAAQPDVTSNICIPKVKESAGAATIYHLNILPDQNDINKSLTHSPKAEFVEHSPGGSKKPNYLMKSIFLDKRSPSLSPNPSPRLENDKQKSFTKLIHGSPIQQYFLASNKRIDNYNYDTNDRGNSDPFANENEQLINELNQHYTYKKKESFGFEEGNSFNSNKNQYEMSYTVDSSIKSKKVEYQGSMGNDNSDQQSNDLTSGKCSFNYINLNELNDNHTLNNDTNTNDEDDLFLRAQQENIYKKRSVPLLNHQTQQYLQQQQQMIQQNQKQFMHAQSGPINQRPSKYLNLGYKPMFQGNSNMMPQNGLNNHLPSQHNIYQPQPNMNILPKNQPNPNQRLNLNQYLPMNNTSNPYQMNLNNNAAIPTNNPYNQSNKFLNINNQPSYPPQRNLPLSMPMSMSIPTPTIQPNQPPQYYQPPTSSFIMNNPTISLDDQTIKYQAYYLSKDQNGCRYLQKIVTDDPQSAIKTIYPIILEHLIELTTDQFGNYLIQKFLEYLDEQKLIQFMGIINPYICSIGLNSYGTRVIQKLMDRLMTDELINSFIIILSPAIQQFIKDQNGNHIMLKLIQMSHMKFDFLFDIVNPNITDLSTHKIGCCFVQKCFLSIKGHCLTSLLDAIIENTCVLVTNQHGNYVIQNVLLVQDTMRNMKIFECIIGNIYFFAKHKFASNVIEKFFEFEYLKEPLIDFFVSNENMAMLLLDNYGNYIIQKTLFFASNDKKERLLYLIAPLLDQLKMVNFGEKLYQKLVIQYPILSNIMFSLKNSTRMTTMI